MRGKTKIRNALTASLVAWLLAASFAIAPASSVVATTLSAPDVVDLTKGPGSTVSIDISVADVSDLWGYQLVLSWDPAMLTFVSFVPQPPFTVSWPSDVGPNYVFIAQSMGLGVKPGLTTVDPKVLVTVNFNVNDYGGTILDLSDSGMIESNGAPIPHYVIDGFFANVPVTTSVELRRCIAEHQIWAEAKDPDNTLHAKVKNKGTVSTNVYVEFTIEDESGVMYSLVVSDTVLLKPNQIHDFTLTVDRFYLIGHGAPVPGYGTYYVHVRVRYYAGGGLWAYGRQPMKFHFTLYPNVPGLV